MALASIGDSLGAPPPTWVPLNRLLCEGAQHLCHVALLCHRMEVSASATGDVGDKLIVVRKVPSGTKSGATVSILYLMFTSHPSLPPPKSNHPLPQSSGSSAPVGLRGVKPNSAACFCFQWLGAGLLRVLHEVSALCFILGHPFLVHFSCHFPRKCPSNAS